MKGFSLLLVVVMLSACSSAPSDIPPGDLLDQAQTLLHGAPGEQNNQQALDLVDRAIAKDSTLIRARQLRVTLLLQAGDVAAAHIEMEQIAALDGSPTNSLFVCMLREAAAITMDDLEACYQQSAHQFEAVLEEPHNDANYALALRFAGAAQFSDVTETFLDTVENEDMKETFRIMLVETERAELIKSFFPALN